MIYWSRDKHCEYMFDDDLIQAAAVGVRVLCDSQISRDNEFLVTDVNLSTLSCSFDL